ncbi:MAG: hypothetical protein ACRDGM_01070, partial [bacterium]
PVPPDRGQEPKEGKLPDLLAMAIILFPGLLAQRVAEYFSTSPKLGDLELIASALAATLAILALTLVILQWVLWRPWAKDPLPTLLKRPAFLVALSVVSVLAGLGWAWLDTRDALFVLPITERVSRADVWERTFRDNAKRKVRKDTKGQVGENPQGQVGEGAKADIEEGTKGQAGKGPKSLATGQAEYKIEPMYVRVVTAGGDVYHGLPTLYSQGSDERALLLRFALKELPPCRKTGGKARCGRTDNVRCTDVGGKDSEGKDREGKVLLLKEQIRIVELRPKIDGKYHCGNPPIQKPPSAKDPRQ